MKTERYLVLGSNSCAGSHFVKYALENGASVLATSRSSENPQRYLAYIKGSTEFLRLDINQGEKEITQLLNSFRPDSVINFASQSMVAESWVTPEDWVTTNNIGLLSLLKSLTAYNALSTYIHYSTPEVYGNVSGRVDEETPFNPSTPYAATRALGDNFVKMWHRQFGLPAIITRAGNVYGPGQRPYRIIPKAFVSMIKEDKIPLHGGGTTKRNFVHGHDSSAAVRSLIEKGVHGTTYHISSNEYISIADLVKSIAARFKKSLSEVTTITSDRPGKDLNYSLGDEKLRSLGWNQSITLDQGIDEVERQIRNDVLQMTKNELRYQHKL